MQLFSTIKLTKLSNGMGVLTVERQDHNVVVGVMVNAGSVNELDVPSGTAHYLEHMVFKGTVTKPTPFDVSAMMERKGGKLNAFTSHKKTAYHVTIGREHVQEGVNMIADMLLNSLFDPEEMERERNVVLEEEAMYRDDPKDRALNNIIKVSYQNHTQGKPIIGTVETISSITRDDLLKFINEYYFPANMISFASGDINHEDHVNYVLNSAWMNVQNNDAAKRPTQAVFESNVILDPMENRTISVGVIGFKVTKDEYLSGKVNAITSALGGGMTTPLFTEVREKRSLVYAVSTGYDSESDIVYFIFITTPEKITKCVEVIKELMTNIDSYVDEHAIDVGKAKTKNSFTKIDKNAMCQLMTFGEMYFNGDFIVTDKINETEVIDIAQVYDNMIDAITKEEISNYAKELLSRQPSIAISGDIPEGLKPEDLW